METKEVLFAIQVGTSLDNLESKDVNSLDSKIDLVSIKLHEVISDTKFSSYRQDRHLKGRIFPYLFSDTSLALSSTTKKLLLMSIIETAAIIGAVLWQIFYVKRLLDNRRII